MHQSRREFLDDFVDFLGEAADAEARNIAERLLNRAETAIWLKHPWRVYQSPVPFMLTLTVNQARYALPDHFGRVAGLERRLRNITKNGAPIYPAPSGDIDVDFPTTGTTAETAGSPAYYHLKGECGVHTQPASTGEALEALSDNASDTDVVVGIAGDDQYGRWTRNQITLNGTTAVSLSTWSFVDELAKAYPATVTPATELTSSRGTVTIRKTSGQAELQKLFTQESARSHPILTLFPKPNAADVIAIPMLRKPKRALRDADAIPDLWVPALWEEMVIEWGVNRGEIRREQAGSVPRPALLDLICFDNEQRGSSRTEPFR